MKYRVSWDIELDADYPLEAAKTALEWLKDPEAICHVFITKDEKGRKHSVDLDKCPGYEVLEIKE